MCRSLSADSFWRVYIISTRHNNTRGTDTGSLYRRRIFIDNYYAYNRNDYQRSIKAWLYYIYKYSWQIPYMCNKRISCLRIQIKASVSASIGKVFCFRVSVSYSTAYSIPLGPVQNILQRPSVQEIRNVSRDSWYQHIHKL